jgi:ABC-2 type transport system permease protein
MQKTLTMMQRELGAYFLSPIAYVVTTVFVFICGLAFGLGTFQPGEESSLRSLLDPWLLITAVLLLPFLTMRLFSEELRSGTIETLMTAPISETQVVMGKFLGALAFYLILLATLLIYPILLARYGSLDWKLMLCNLLGLFFLGSLYIAVGLFFSACTKHQIIAVLLSIGLLIILTLAGQPLATRIEWAWPRVALQQLSIRMHYHDFVRGMVDVNHVVFFVTTTAAFLFFTVKKLEMRRWQ